MSGQPSGRIPAALALAMAVVAATGLSAAASGPSSRGMGVNDWSCRPSSSHPRPVVLVHNDFQNADNNWAFFGPALAEAGYCVYTLTYGVPAEYAALAGTPAAPGALIRNEDSAGEVAAFIARVQHTTHAHRVDIVGDGMGTLVVQYWLTFLGGASQARTFVALAPVWHGTTVWEPMAQLGAGSVIYPADAEVRTGSAFLRHLGVKAVPGIRYTSVMAKNDEVILPYTSGVMPDAVNNVVLQDVCPSDAAEHWSLAYDPVVVRMTLNALDPAHAAPIDCSRALLNTVLPDPLPKVVSTVQQHVPY